MSRRNEQVDSEIEQQLAGDAELFARMAAGVEDEEVAVEEPEPREEVPQVREEAVVEESEVVVDEPEETQIVEDEEELVDEEEVDTPPSTKVEKIYTPEEIKELLADGDISSIDTSRLSEEGKLVMKSMQAGLTPKLQEAAELRRQMAELTETVQKAIPKPQPKDIFEAYDQDPDGVVAFLNKNVNEAIQAGDTTAIEQAKEYRDQVRHYASTKPPAVEPQMEVNNASVELLKAVPDIQEKQTKLRDFALEKMGYTQDELAYLTDITRGQDAVREIVRINTAYETFTAPQRAKAKAVKKKPTKVEKSGGGFDKKETTNKDRIAQAKKSGSQSDWYEVFLNMED